MSLSAEEKEKFMKAMKITEQYGIKQCSKRIRNIFSCTIWIIFSFGTATLFDMKNQIIMFTLGFIIPIIFVLLLIVEMIKAFRERETFNSASEYIESLIILERHKGVLRMNKNDVVKTQEMWKDYPITKYWIDTIKHPQKHGLTGIPDSDYLKAIESLEYILLGKTII